MVPEVILPPVVVHPYEISAPEAELEPSKVIVGAAQVILDVGAIESNG